MKYLIPALILTSFMLFRCAIQPVKEEPKPIISTCKKNEWCSDWDKLVYENLETYGKELLSFQPKDKAEWCFGEDNKLNYLRLIQAMAKYESSYDPETVYKESFKDQKGANVLSVGLLQVSQESCGYYGAKFTTEELKLVKNNLNCAVRILNKWIPKDGIVAKEKLGAGRYWSVLRPGPKKDAIKKIMCGGK